MKPKKVVVIGGGTGTSVVISGLKQHPLDITAIITVADSGGSTGRLRDEFGFQPVGDLRQSLAALAKENDQSWIRDLLLYRFSHGQGLKGHNLGNLILTALQDMTGSTPIAIEKASKIFRLEGHIYPSTTQNVQLVTEYQDGTVVIGEHNLDDPKLGGKQITSVKLSPKAALYPKARQAIEQADAIIIGPGDLYGSLIPNLVTRGAKAAFAKTSASIIYIMNLMTRYTQTHRYSMQDHIKAIEKQLGKPVSHIVINQQAIPKAFLSAYAFQHEYPVTDDLPQDSRVIRANLLKTTRATTHTADDVPRSYLRHHPQKLATTLIKVINS